MMVWELLHLTFIFKPVIEGIKIFVLFGGPRDHSSFLLILYCVIVGGLYSLIIRKGHLILN